MGTLGRRSAVYYRGGDEQTRGELGEIYTNMSKLKVEIVKWCWILGVR